MHADRTHGEPEHRHGDGLHAATRTARRRCAKGLEGFKFFGFALAHYYIVGTQVPGRTNIWEAFKKAPPFPEMPTGGIGTPDEVRANLEKFEEVGVDQVVFIQQGGNNRHADICSSLELFAQRVMPEFKARHDGARAEEGRRSWRRTSRRRWRRSRRSKPGDGRAGRVVSRCS